MRPLVVEDANSKAGKRVSDASPHDTRHCCCNHNLEYC